MKNRKIDPHAASASYLKNLSPCLYVPIAARTLEAIETYVGDIVENLVFEKAFLVSIHSPQPPDLNLPIWQLPHVSVLHQNLQVWVEVNYKYYRAAFAQAFPEMDIIDHVLDHVLNRRLARLKGFAYLRIVPVSRATNSSHGGLSEKWGVNHQSREIQRIENNKSKAVIQYADIADITKMLDIGGQGSFMDGANVVHQLAKPPANNSN